jgi:pimeloyl-ACP methyl ester carboxylesterase
MNHIVSPAGVSLSYDSFGAGPPLVLVHGGFSDHHSNWMRVRPLLERAFTLFAVARRGRGETDATTGHTLEDEARDVAALIQAVGEPVFLLGHSYGAHVALLAAERLPGRVLKLVLYEPPRPSLMTPDLFDRLEALGEAGEWDRFATTFFRDGLRVPGHELEALRLTEDWPPILADALATRGDLRALFRHGFDAARFRGLPMPVQLLVGSESPRDLYVTDALAAVLRNARIDELQDQAHEGMTTAPEMFTATIRTFLLEG